MPKDKKTFDDRLWDTVVQLVLWITLVCAGFLIAFVFDVNNGRVGFRQENSWPEILWALCICVVVFRFYFGNNSFIASLLSEEHNTSIRAFHIIFIFSQLFIQLMIAISIGNIWLSVSLTAILFFSDVIWYVCSYLIGGEEVQDDKVMKRNQVNNFVFGAFCVVYLLHPYFVYTARYSDFFLNFLIVSFIVNFVFDIYINRARYF